MLDSKKKNRVKTITFFGLLLVILTGLSVALSGYAGKHSELVKDRNRALTGLGEEPDHTIDLLVIGDSECYTTVSPMDLWKDHGITAYLGGQSGQKIQESYYMLKTALETQKPKLVMMETNVLYRSADKPDALQDIFIRSRTALFSGVSVIMTCGRRCLPGTKAGETDYKGYVPRTNVQPIPAIVPIWPGQRKRFRSGEKQCTIIWMRSCGSAGKRGLHLCSTAVRRRSTIIIKSTMDLQPMQRNRRSLTWI